MGAAISKSNQWIVFVINVCVWSLLPLGPETVCGRDFAVFKFVRLVSVIRTFAGLQGLKPG
jgi:hypothetical protein